MNALDRECSIFCEYLIGAKPTDYVLRKYQDAHATGSIGQENKLQPFDRVMLSLASVQPFATRIVDAYASVFFRNSSVRRKLILLLAILESCAPYHHQLDSVDCGSPGVLLFKMTLKGLAWGIVFVAAIVTLVPVRALVGFAIPMFQRSATIWKES